MHTGIQDSHIAELRKQVNNLQRRVDKLQKQLDAWPRRAMEHAIKARLSERRRCNAETLRIMSRIKQ